MLSEIVAEDQFCSEVTISDDSSFTSIINFVDVATAHWQTESRAA